MENEEEDEDNEAGASSADRKSRITGYSHSVMSKNSNK
jgi:hypothetical protein